MGANGQCLMPILIAIHPINSMGSFRGILLKNVFKSFQTLGKSAFAANIEVRTLFSRSGKQFYLLS